MNALRKGVLAVMLGAALAFAASCTDTPKNETCSGQSCDGGTESGVDAGADAGPDDGADAGVDAGADAGMETEPFADFASFDQSRTEAICQLAVKCGVFASVEGCKAANYVASDEIGIDSTAEAAAIRDSRATFDGTEARACVNAIAGAACADYASAVSLSDQACADAVKGALPMGGNCFADLECEPTAYCSANAWVCPSQCLDRKAEGELVGRSRECQPGLVVDANGACAAPVAKGQSCAGASSFDPNKECVADAWCDENKICSAKGSVDADCETDQQCLSPYVCRSGKCTTRGAAGASCSYVPVEECQRDLICDTSARDQPGTCAAPKAAGGSCFESAQCEAGTFCRGTPEPNTCAAPNALGESCEPYVEGECPADAYCDSSAKKCLRKSAVGEACTDQGSCMDGAVCDVTCKPVACRSP